MDVVMHTGARLRLPLDMDIVIEDLGVRAVDELDAPRIGARVIRAARADIASLDGDVLGIQDPDAWP
jgi:hypothetical protein